MAFEDFVSTGFANAALYEEMYAHFLENPHEVDVSWHQYFTHVDPSSGGQSDSIRVKGLIQAYREWGHLMARVNPLAKGEAEIPEELKIEAHGFKNADLKRLVPTCGIASMAKLPLSEIIAILKKTYCGTVGVEYMGLHSHALEEWLQAKIEPSHFHIDLTIDEKRLILEHLNKSSLLEWFLQTKYVGQKRFSLEGGETLIPILAEMIQVGAKAGAKEFHIGMAHRGRLNVLCNILDKSYSDIFSEFEPNYIPDSIEGSGDVKYHKGFSSDLGGIKVQITPNPSHLESVNSVVEGVCYARQRELSEHAVVPVLIHGDAALSGQGSIYETMQFCRLNGYSTGGTIHIVINNQIGFTTLPEEGRSTRYCTDIARSFGAPIFHVNGEDPEACVYTMMLAMQLRKKFKCDVFIDLYCYRKYGHNEGDEPSFTQPLEYQAIRARPSVREMYRDDLIQQGAIEKQIAEELEQKFKGGLQEALNWVREQNEKKPEKKEKVFDPFKAVKTSVKKEILEACLREMDSVPEGFHIHPKLEKVVKQRHENFPDTIDWAGGELLAYATLVKEGKSIRLSGQDCGRGTFSHRHARWLDQENGSLYIPLASMGDFTIYNSPLSEFAVLGFEYGYSSARLDDLVIWEAQFGDFANGAQVIMDQYLSTGEEKWGQKSNLTLLLPHGYEGQGPEHSSARIERFLTLCGENNMFVVNPSSPAQMFHVLRRQMLHSDPKPLIIFTPKGLLRHPQCVSKASELSHSSFNEVIATGKKNATRILFCSGRIYYDLIEHVKEGTAIIRIEQLYPLHKEKIIELIQKFPEADTFVWVQEEPANMGAWSFIRERLSAMLPNHSVLRYVGRKSSASTAAGSLHRHNLEFKAIIDEVFS